MQSKEKLIIMTILFHLKDFLRGKYTLPCQLRQPDKAQTNFALLPFGRGQSLCCSHSLSLQPRRLPGTTIQSWRKRAKPRLVMLVVQTHTVPLPSLHPSSFECINMLWKKKCTGSSKTRMFNASCSPKTTPLKINSLRMLCSWHLQRVIFLDWMLFSGVSFQ